MDKRHALIFYKKKPIYIRDCFINNDNIKRRKIKGKNGGGKQFEKNKCDYSLF